MDKVSKETYNKTRTLTLGHMKPLSREFLLSRGYCCHNSCTNCPYDMKEEALKLLEEIEENVNTCCAITMEPEEVLELIDKLKEVIKTWKQ